MMLSVTFLFLLFLFPDLSRASYRVQKFAAFYLSSQHLLDRLLPTVDGLGVVDFGGRLREEEFLCGARWVFLLRSGRVLVCGLLWLNFFRELDLRFSVGHQVAPRLAHTVPPLTLCFSSATFSLLVALLE